MKINLILSPIDQNKLPQGHSIAKGCMVPSPNGTNMVTKRCAIASGTSFMKNFSEELEKVKAENQTVKAALTEIQRTHERTIKNLRADLQRQNRKMKRQRREDNQRIQLLEDRLDCMDSCLDARQLAINIDKALIQFMGASNGCVSMVAFCKQRHVPSNVVLNRIAYTLQHLKKHGNDVAHLGRPFDCPRARKTVFDAFVYGYENAGHQSYVDTTAGLGQYGQNVLNQLLHCFGESALYRGENLPPIIDPGQRQEVVNLLHQRL